MTKLYAYSGRCSSGTGNTVVIYSATDNNINMERCPQYDLLLPEIVEEVVIEEVSETEG